MKALAAALGLRVVSESSFSTPRNGTLNLFVYRIDFDRGSEPSFQTFISLHDMARFKGRKIEEVAEQFVRWLGEEQRGLQKTQDRSFWTATPRRRKLRHLDQWYKASGRLDLRRVWIKTHWAKKYLLDTLDQEQNAAYFLSVFRKTTS